MTKRAAVAHHTPAPEPTAQRRLAEDLLAGLDYLEQKAVTHKDLKPDNLLVSDGRLTIIDFSLAAAPEDAPYGGTALYRDPASARWTHATDRFAGGPLPLRALCRPARLRWARAGAWASYRPSARTTSSRPGSRVLPQGARPRTRRGSLRLGRCATPCSLRLARMSIPASIRRPQQIDAHHPSRLTGLSRRAINALARCQVHTVGELLALSAAQVRAIHAIGTKTADDIIAFQETLARPRHAADHHSSPRADPPLVFRSLSTP